MIEVGWSAAVVVALVFLLVLALDRWFFEPLAVAMETRKKIVGSAEAVWAETRQVAGEAEATWREATTSARAEGYRLLERARGAALAERQRRVENEREAALVELAGARESLRREADQAVEQLQREAERLATDLASRLLGREVA